MTVGRSQDIKNRLINYGVDYRWLQSADCLQTEFLCTPHTSGGDIIAVSNFTDGHIIYDRYQNAFERDRQTDFVTMHLHAGQKMQLPKVVLFSA